MPANVLLQRVLADEALTRHLGDAEARVLVEWLIDRAEELTNCPDEAEADRALARLCRRGRAIARFVSLWTQPRSRGAAFQLAGAERFAWPLPGPDADPCEVMEDIVAWESHRGPPPERWVA